MKTTSLRQFMTETFSEGFLKEAEVDYKIAKAEGKAYEEGRKSATTELHEARAIMRRMCDSVRSFGRFEFAEDFLERMNNKYNDRDGVCCEEMTSKNIIETLKSGEKERDAILDRSGVPGNYK